MLAEEKIREAKKEREAEKSLAKRNKKRRAKEKSRADLEWLARGQDESQPFSMGLSVIEMTQTIGSNFGLDTLNIVQFKAGLVCSCDLSGKQVDFARVDFRRRLSLFEEKLSS